jgi:hypothetical protein
MNFHKIKTIIVLLGLCIGLSISTQANACDFVPEEAPARTSISYRNVNAGFSFSIPANYRIIARKHGVIVLSPSLYKYVKCITKKNIRTEFPQESFSVSIVPIRSRNASIRSLVIKEMPWIEKEGFDFRSVNFLGKQALVFSQMNNVDDLKLNYTSFLSPDRKYLIIIYGPEKDRELIDALATFKFK